MVVGTSIGAFIGGLYASGHSAADIEHKLQHTPWASGFRDRVYRDEMPLRRKEQSDNFALNVDLGISTDGVKLPKGILSGQALAEILQRTFGIFADQDLLLQPDLVDIGTLDFGNIDKAITSGRQIGTIRD